MMTNLDIESETLAEAEAAAKARGESLRDFVNRALRQAIDAPREVRTLARYVQEIHDFGTHIESPWTLLADIESEEYVRRTHRK